MKYPLILLAILPVLFSSCVTHRVTDDSPKFERYYEAAKRCFKATSGSQKIGGGVMFWRSDILAYFWGGTTSAGKEVKCVCMVERGYHLAGQTYDGVLRSFPEEQEEAIAYNKLDKIFLECGCPIYGEPELNQKIREKISIKPNIWKFSKTGAP